MEMAPQSRFERPTCPLGGDCSIHLSYRGEIKTFAQRYFPVASASLHIHMQAFMGKKSPVDSFEFPHPSELPGRGARIVRLPVASCQLPVARAKLETPSLTTDN